MRCNNTETDTSQEHLKAKGVKTMGWIIYDWSASPSNYREEKREIENILGDGIEAIRKVGSVWYVAQRVKPQHAQLGRDVGYILDSDNSHVYCAVILTTRRDGAWGYKPLTEAMGPMECKCPASVLSKLSPLDTSVSASKYAVEWRENCAAWNNRPRAKDGDTVTLASPVQFVGFQTQRLRKVAVAGRRNIFIPLDAGNVGLVRLRSDHLLGVKIDS
jgi:hypothetical protein